MNQDSSLTQILLAYIAERIHFFKKDFIQCLPHNLLLLLFRELQHHEDIETLNFYFSPILFPHSYIGDISFQLNGRMSDDIFTFLKHFRVKSLNLSHCMLSDHAFRFETIKSKINSNKFENNEIIDKSDKLNRKNKKNEIKNNEKKQNKNKQNKKQIHSKTNLKSKKKYKDTGNIIEIEETQVNQVPSILNESPKMKDIKAPITSSKKSKNEYLLNQSLQSLNISYIPKLSYRTIAFLSSNFHGMRSLSLESNEKINNHSLKLIARGMPLLKGLNIRGCKCVTSITALYPLNYLEILNISFLPRFSKIEELNPLSSSLNYIDLSHCQKIHDLANWKTVHFKKLKTLDISNCIEISNISRIGHLVNLESLSLSNLFKIRNLDPLVNLKKLTHINIQGCKDLYSLNSLKEFEELKILNISKILIPLDEEEIFESLTKLISLNICGCNFQSFRCLLKLKNIEHLQHDNVNLGDPSCWKNVYSSMPNLRSIHASNSYQGIMDESVLFPMDSIISTLVLSGSTNVQDSWVSYFPQELKVLDISFTMITPDGVTKIEALKNKKLEIFVANGIFIENNLNINRDQYSVSSIDYNSIDSPRDDDLLYKLEDSSFELNSDCSFIEEEIQSSDETNSTLDKAFDIISSCTSLISLDISNSNLSNHTLMKISNLKLKHLEINNCYRINIPNAILSLGSTLQDLGMYDINVSNKFFISFPTQMIRLHTLKISTTHFEEKQILDCLQMIPNLVYLRKKEYKLKR